MRAVVPLLLAVVVGTGAWCAVLNVPAEYQTIQSAINAANAGDTIQIAAGTYAENLTLTKALALRGAGRDTTTITAATSAPVISINGSTSSIVGDVVIDGLKLTDPEPRKGVNYLVFAKRLTADCSLTISNNLFTDCEQFGVWDYLCKNTLTITGNVFSELNAPILVEKHTTSPVTITGNECFALEYNDDYGSPLGINPLTYGADGDCDNLYTISGNYLHDFANPGHGVVVIGGANWTSEPPAKYTNMRISNNRVENVGTTGIYLYNASTGYQDPEGGVPGADLSGNTISDCTDGLRVVGANPDVSVADSYAEDVARFVRLTYAPENVDARGCTFGGTTSPADIEAKVWHKYDDSDLGWVIYDADQVLGNILAWDKDDQKFYLTADASDPASGTEVENGKTYYYGGNPLVVNITGVSGDKQAVVSGASGPNALRVRWYMLGSALYRAYEWSTIGATAKTAVFQRGQTYIYGEGWQSGFHGFCHTLSNGPTWDVAYSAVQQR